MKINIALILFMVTLLGIDFGAAESNTIFESGENILESKLVMFVATVVAAFIIGYMCISNSCQPILPTNTLTKLVSIFNGRGSLVNIKGNQWIKKTTFEICINPAVERKCLLKTWLDTIWPSSEQDQMALKNDTKLQETRIESSRSTGGTDYHGTLVDLENETEPKPNKSRPKSWFLTLKDIFAPILGNPPMETKQEVTSNSDPKAELVHNTSPWSSSSESLSRKVDLSEVKPYKSKSGSMIDQPLKSTISELPNYLAQNQNNGILRSSYGPDMSMEQASMPVYGQKWNSIPIGMQYDPEKLGSSTQPFQFTLSDLPNDPTQAQKNQNNDILRTINGLDMKMEQNSMPVYGQKWNSMPMRMHSNPHQDRPKNCSKSIAITAVVCVSLTVLLMCGLFVLVKLNSEQLLQFGQTMAQIFNRSG